MDQGLLICDTLPFSIPLDPGVGKSSAMHEGLSAIRAFGSIDAGSDGGVSVEVNAGIGVDDFFGFE
jgi:hypothetical protein